MKTFTFVLNERETAIVGNALMEQKQIIADANKAGKNYGVQTRMFSGGVDYTSNHELLDLVEATHDNLNEQRNNIDLGYIANPSNYFLWQKIEGFDLVDNSSYWVAYGHGDYSGDVRKVWYEEKYNAFFYKGGQHYADNPYQVSLSEVKFIMPVFEPDRPSDGTYGTKNTF